MSKDIQKDNDKQNKVWAGCKQLQHILTEDAIPIIYITYTFSQAPGVESLKQVSCVYF